MQCHYKNSVEFAEIAITEKTPIEYQVIRIIIGDMFYWVMNVYLPPYRTELMMVTEIGQILHEIRTELKNDEIIMLGDFNFSQINWIYNASEAGYLSKNRSSLRPYEERFIQECSKYCVYRKNHAPDSKLIDRFM